MRGWEAHGKLRAEPYVLLTDFSVRGLAGRPKLPLRIATLKLKSILWDPDKAKGVCDPTLG